jgi:cytochrome b subunit of formate dehydrogenase
MDNPITATPPVQAGEAAHSKAKITRFNLSERIEHITFLVSFSLLGITGLAQRYANTSAGQWVLEAFGGINGARTVHHISAFFMMWITLYHVIATSYRVFVMRQPWSMMPVIDDFKHLMADLAYYFGLRKHKAYYGRYNYAEKMEYLAVVWGTIIMGITGFMMWNPLTTTKYLPGEFIPAAKAAHSAEAVLAVLAIFIWHMYHVHIKRFNKSMFNGQLTREEMEEEHPAELAEMESGYGWKRPPQEVVRKRMKIFTPVAVGIALFMSLGIIWFVTVEPQSALGFVPKAETAAVFVPITPTPRPTPMPSPTPEAGTEATVGTDTWDGTYAGLFKNRCGVCHISGNLGGLSLATYQSALQGGSTGPGIVPGNPDDSAIVKMQFAGGHPGQLSIDELDAVIAWIKAGAPEK